MVIRDLFCERFGSKDYRDDRVIDYIYPKKILLSGSAEEPEALLDPSSAQATLESGKACVLKKDGFVLIDFGFEMQGGIQIVTDIWGYDTDNTARVRVRFGESAMECMADSAPEKRGGKNATNDHAIRDGIHLVSWLGMTEIGNTGFRFVRIDLLDDISLPLKCVRAKFQYRDLKYLGSFECDDERLNDIWKTAAYTVQLNMQEYVWDGVKRDRLVWIGDMHPETSTIQYIFGDQKCVRDSLDLIRDNTPLPNVMNGIPAYSLWWLLIHHDRFIHYGDLEYLEQQHSYITELLHYFSGYITETGEISIENCFLDWPSSTNPDGQRAGVHALFCLVCDGCAEMLDALSDIREADFARLCAEQLRKYRYPHNGLKQALALQVLAGLADPNDAYDELLGKDGVHGFSTFLGYYILKALGEADKTDFALDCIRDYWGGMLDLGATTFWEDFDIDWTKNCSRIDEILPADSEKSDIHGDFGGYCYVGYRHSFCHGWASGPAPFLMEYVLGVRPIEAGSREVLISPSLGDLKYAKGSVPTPYGVIEVSHTKMPDGGVKTTYNAPDGIEVVLG